MRRAVLPATAGLLLVAAVAGAQAPARPSGTGADVLRARCLSCHGTDLIAQQRLDAAGWTRAVAKMERWGARLDEGERAALVAYLAAEYGPRPRGAAAPRATADDPARGEAILQRACLACHGRDLIAQQRLTRTGWLRSIDKMVRWGAAIAADERETLAAYLAQGR